MKTIAADMTPDEIDAHVSAEAARRGIRLDALRPLDLGALRRAAARRNADETRELLTAAGIGHLAPADDDPVSPARAENERRMRDAWRTAPRAPGGAGGALRLDDRDDDDPVTRARQRHEQWAASAWKTGGQR